MLDDEEGRRERPDLDVESEVLDALAVHNAGVEEGRAIFEAEGEMCSDDEEVSDMSDEDEMSEDDMSDEADDTKVAKEPVGFMEESKVGDKTTKSTKVCPTNLLLLYVV